MSAALIDWTGGPVACRDCGRRMRPHGADSQDWPATVMHGGDGCCLACRPAPASSGRERVVVAYSGEWTLSYPHRPTGGPGDGLAAAAVDLQAYLDRQGLEARGPVSSRRRHDGDGQVLVLTLPVARTVEVAA